MVKTLVERLRALHKRGSLHIMDEGNVCVGCGGQWPCRTVEIIREYAEEVAFGDE